MTVSVELGADDEVVVTVRDDGRGGASMDAGTGLRGIRERAEALRGGLEVDSPPGGGTVVRAWLPASSALVAVTEAVVSAAAATDPRAGARILRGLGAAAVVAVAVAVCVVALLVIVDAAAPSRSRRARPP